MEDALVNFVRTGKLSFSDLANSIIADLARIAARQAIGGIFGSLLGGGAGLGGGSFAGSFGLAHAGGTAGALTRHRYGVDPRVFTGARRYHRGGLVGDEVPIIARRGETVRTPEQEAALGSRGTPVPVTINHENRGTPQRVVEADASLDFGGLVISVVTEDIAAGGDVARAIEGIVPGTTL